MNISSGMGRRRRLWGRRGSSTQEAPRAGSRRGASTGSKRVLHRKRCERHDLEIARVLTI